MHSKIYSEQNTQYIKNARTLFNLHAIDSIAFLFIDIMSSYFIIKSIKSGFNHLLTMNSLSIR